MSIIEKKNLLQTEIGEHSAISLTSVNWHIKRFEDAKIIDETMEGRFKHYKLRSSSKLVVATLKNFYPHASGTCGVKQACGNVPIYASSQAVEKM
jgi:DNA-binding transcriptional ArsR family regulator